MSSEDYCRIYGDEREIRCYRLPNVRHAPTLPYEDDIEPAPSAPFVDRSQRRDFHRVD
jgi:hypothetical protein